MFVGLQISAGYGLVLVAVEFVQGGNGLGHLIWSPVVFNAQQMYRGNPVVAVLGLVLTATGAAARLPATRITVRAATVPENGRAGRVTTSCSRTLSIGNFLKGTVFCQLRASPGPFSAPS